MFSYTNLMEQGQNSSRFILIVDSAGALLSAFLLSVVLVRYEWFFGIPLSVLHILVAPPCFFMFYDLLVYFYVKGAVCKYIITLAYCNIGYCILSLTLAASHYHAITKWGWIYIILEVLVVLLIARIELNIVYKSKDAK